MNPVDELVRAWHGVALIGAGKPEAAAQFKSTGAGLLVALGWLALAMLLTAAAQSVAVGLPRWDQLIAGLAIQGATMAALFALTRVSLGFLRLTTSALALFVPMTYLLGLMQIAAIPLVLLGPNVQVLAVLAAAFLIGRAGRVVGGMSVPNAIAFGLLSLMALVAVPVALYMVFVAIPLPA